MYWGRKILEWPATAEDALAGMERKADVAAYIKEIEDPERTGKETTT